MKLHIYMHTASHVVHIYTCTLYCNILYTVCYSGVFYYILYGGHHMTRTNMYPIYMISFIWQSYIIIIYYIYVATYICVCVYYMYDVNTCTHMYMYHHVYYILCKCGHKYSMLKSYIYNIYGWNSVCMLFLEKRS